MHWKPPPEEYTTFWKVLHNTLLLRVAGYKNRMRIKEVKWAIKNILANEYVGTISEEYKKELHFITLKEEKDTIDY